jgi:DNA-binding NtrC family response regulator
MSRRTPACYGTGVCNMKALVVDEDEVVRGLLGNALSRMGLDAIEAPCSSEILRLLADTEDIGIAIIETEDGNIHYG